MDFKNIKVRAEQAVGFVQIDRVADKNSLNIETSKEILQALTLIFLKSIKDYL
ncbi:MAG: hypothetical protein ACKN91_03025 [Candidatus Fonsibacter sp.]